MAVYRCVGEFTYSNKSQRDACLAQVNAAVSGAGPASPWADMFAGGVTTQGNTGIRASFELPNEATALAFEKALRAAAATNTKTASALTLAKVGGT